MSATSDIATYLDGALELRVVANVSTLPNLAAPLGYVAGQRTEPRPFPFREHTLDVWVLVPEVDAAKADKTLDGLIDAVLDAIDAHPIATWTEAERTVYGTLPDGFHAYRITVSTTTQREP